MTAQIIYIARPLIDVMNILSRNLEYQNIIQEIVDQNITAMNSEIRKDELRRKGYKIL